MSAYYLRVTSTTYMYCLDGLPYALHSEQLMVCVHLDNPYIQTVQTDLVSLHTGT